MKRILTFMSLLCMLATLPAAAQKNVVDPSRVKQLVVQNASALGLSQKDLDNIRVNYAYTDNTSGAIMAYLQQTWMGVDVYNAISTVTFKNDKLFVGNYHSLPEFDLVTKNKQNVPAIPAAAAVQKAANEIGLSIEVLIQAISRSADGFQQNFGKLGIGVSDITAHLMWVPAEDNISFKLGWQVSINPNDRSDGWLVNIDAQSGAAISKTNLLIRERGNLNLKNVHQYLQASHRFCHLG